MTSDGGKGSTPRPTDHEAFSKAFERIFGKKPSADLKQRYDEAACIASEKRWMEQQKEEGNGR
jgi:hypothetical protein